MKAYVRRLKRMKSASRFLCDPGSMGDWERRKKQAELDRAAAKNKK